MMCKKALITGQDGSYLAEFLLNKGYEVFGLVRRTSILNFERIKYIQDRIKLISGDLLDQNSLMNVIKESNPEEIYNLASHLLCQLHGSNLYLLVKQLLWGWRECWRQLGQLIQR